MFDKLAEMKISGDGKVTAKRRITDEETVAEAEFAEARDVISGGEEVGTHLGDRFSPQAGMPKLSGRVTGRPSRISCNLSICASVRSNARSRLASWRIAFGPTSMTITRRYRHKIAASFSTRISSRVPFGWQALRRLVTSES